MKLKIVKYGDGRLREPAVPVGSIEREHLELAADMLETMAAAKGVGLAAQQVGRTESLCVIDIPRGCEEDDDTEAFNAAAADMPLVMFNPEIVAADGEQRGNEGCLSFPNVGGTVTRPARVVCTYVAPDGAPHTVIARGFLARAIMHETDHLKGVLYIDHMTDAERKALDGKLKKVLNGKR